MQKVLNGEDGFSSLPYIYTGGFLHLDLVKKIKAHSPSNLFFHSINPDVYSGVAATSMTTHYLHIWDPLAIAGISQHSNGTAILTLSAHEVENLPFFRENGKSFHPSLGSGFATSEQLLVYESYLQSSSLREFRLEVSLGKILALSILNARKGRVNETIEYCRSVAEQNYIDFDGLLKMVGDMRVETKMKKLFKKPLQILRNEQFMRKKSISGDNTLMNIYDAAQMAHTLCVSDNSRIIADHSF